MSTKPTTEAGVEQRATQWATLSKFEVTVQQRTKVTAPLYANGYQQVEVRVELIAHDAFGDEVFLTQEQLMNIRLIDYATSQHHKTVLQDTRFVYNWQVYGKSDEEQPQSGDPSTRGQEKNLYVFRNQPGTLKLAAEITSPSGVIYRTNTTAGNFDSWIIVEAREPLVHHWSALVMDGPVNLITNSSWDVDMYYIRFSNNTPGTPALRIVFSHHHGVPDGNAFYSWPKDGWARKNSVLYQLGAPQKMRFPKMHSSGIDVPINDREGQACAARISARSDYGVQQSSSWGVITYIDQHGNKVPALVAPSSNGNTLSLAETGPHAVTPEEPEGEGGTPTA